MENDKLTSKNDNNSASLNDLYIFFKNASNQGAGSISGTEYVPNFSNDENNELINQPITENEILTAVRSLKNNKSPGVDNIVNEQIKATISYMLPIYVKLLI